MSTLIVHSPLGSPKHLNLCEEADTHLLQFCLISGPRRRWRCFTLPAFTGIGVGGTGLEEVFQGHPTQSRKCGDRLFLQTLHRGSVCQAFKVEAACLVGRSDLENACSRLH